LLYEMIFAVNVEGSFKLFGQISYINIFNIKLIAFILYKFCFEVVHNLFYLSYAELVSASDYYNYLDPETSSG